MTLTQEQKARIKEEFAKWEVQQYVGNYKEKQTKLAQFFTPAEFAYQLVEKFDTLEDKDILDPTVGLGNLLAACIVAGADPKRCHGIELDEAVLEVAKKRLAELGVPEDNLTHGDALEQSSYKKKFDCIIMNPPYKQGLHLRIVDVCMSSLKDDGVLVSLCPANSFEKFKFFAPKMSKHLDKIREYVEDIKLLSFKVWNTIGLNVNFCFMTCKQNPTTHYFDNFFESDIEKSLYKKVSSIYATKKVYSLYDGYAESYRKDYKKTLQAYSAQVGLHA